VEKPYTEKPKSKLVPILLGIAVVLLGGIYGLLVSQIQKPDKTQPAVTPTPVAEPSIATTQPLSGIATSSAFMALNSLSHRFPRNNALKSRDTTSIRALDSRSAGHK
jgi:hypothetical protein